MLVHPFFSSNKSSQDKEPAPTAFKWLKPFDNSCLHGVYLEPESHVKLAAFDLDGTIIESNFRKPGVEWAWWNTIVPARLRSLHNEGYALFRAWN